MRYHLLGRSGLRVSELALGAINQMAENLGALSFELAPEHRTQLDRDSAIELGFPREFLLTSRHATYGGALGQIRNHRAEVDMPPELARAAHADAAAPSPSSAR